MVLLMAIVIVVWMLSYIGGKMMWMCIGFNTGLIITFLICSERLKRAMKERDEMEAHRLELQRQSREFIEELKPRQE